MIRDNQNASSSLAHIRYNAANERFEQTVNEHHVQVARLAAEKLTGTGFTQCAYLAGLLHDMGKCCDKFQAYLEAATNGEKVDRGSVNHTFAGCIYILEKYHESADPFEKITAEILACVIGSHHGLFDCLSVDGQKNGFKHRLEKDRAEIQYAQAKARFFKEVTTEAETENLFSRAVSEIRSAFNSFGGEHKDWFCLSLVIRLLQSALIASDHEDTRLFMTGEALSPVVAHDWTEDIRFFEEKSSAFRADTPLNQVRKFISDTCKEFAIQNPPGIYRLSVGTGGGKTLSSQRFALHHAQTYGKKRIIYVVPFLSILDQNAMVVREYTPPSTTVLEHHSNVIMDDQSEEELTRYELLKQSWDAPIILTTMVQLLEILFSHQTSRIARMQALVDSILIIDEVQSLPVKTTAMFSVALNMLQKYCGTTVILSSATQPKLDAIDGWELDYAKPADIVHLTEKQQEVFCRTNFHFRHDPYGKTAEEFLEETIEKINSSPSTLVICNTKRVARNLFHSLRERQDPTWELYHLSTSMCQKHRVDVLREIRESLSVVQQQKTDRKVICISTQLVEAGIDFSFHTVIRALAGLDNIVQAEGRCNRSNEYGEKGEVYLIKLAEENLSMLQEIRIGKECTEGILKDASTALTAKRTIAKYFENYYTQSKNHTKYPLPVPGGAPYYMAELLGNGLEKIYHRSTAAKGYFLKQPFREVAQMFRVFDDDTVDVVVPYGEEGETLVQTLRSWNDRYDFAGLNELVKRAKQYTISIFPYQLKNLCEAGMLHPALHEKVYVLDTLAYDADEGVLPQARHMIEDYIL